MAKDDADELSEDIARILATRRGTPGPSHIVAGDVDPEELPSVTRELQRKADAKIEQALENLRLNPEGPEN